MGEQAHTCTDSGLIKRGAFVLWWGGSFKEYHQGIYIVGLPKYFLVKFPKLNRGLWAKRLVNFNFEGNPRIFYQVPEAPNVVILRLFWLKWRASKLTGRGKLHPEGAQNWSAFTFFIHSSLRSLSLLTKNIWTGLTHSRGKKWGGCMYWWKGLLQKLSLLTSGVSWTAEAIQLF